MCALQTWHYHPVNRQTDRHAHTRMWVIDRERKLWYLFCKQFPPLDVKLVHNAMEGFQQKVPPISLGAFEDIFDWKVKGTTGSQYPPFSFLGEGSVLRHRLTINITRFNTHLHKHGWRNFGREIDLFKNDLIFWHHFTEVKKSRVSRLPCGGI
jgi:hypothetical protein